MSRADTTHEPRGGDGHERYTEHSRRKIGTPAILRWVRVAALPDYCLVAVRLRVSIDPSNSLAFAWRSLARRRGRRRCRRREDIGPSAQLIRETLVSFFAGQRIDAIGLDAGRRFDQVKIRANSIYDLARRRLAAKKYEPRLVVER